MDLSQIKSVFFCVKELRQAKYLPSRTESSKLAWQQNQLHAGVRAKLLLHQVGDKFPTISESSDSSALGKEALKET